MLNLDEAVYVYSKFELFLAFTSQHNFSFFGILEITTNCFGGGGYVLFSTYGISGLFTGAYPGCIPVLSHGPNNSYFYLKCLSTTKSLSSVPCSCQIDFSQKRGFEIKIIMKGLSV